MPSKSKCSWWFTSAMVTTAAFVCLVYIYLTNKEKQAKNTIYQKLIPVPEKLIKDEKCVPICNSKECVLFAKYLHKYVKPEANPCENAHTFICGNFLERFAEDEGMNAYFEAESTLYKILNNIIKDTQADPESAVGKMKTMYDSCMKNANSEKYALLTAQNFLKDIGIPDWPHLPEDFHFLNTDIPNLLGNLKVKGEMLFFSFISYNFKLEEKEYINVGLDGRYFDRLLKPPCKESIIHILKYFKLDSEAIELIWNDYNAVRDSILKLKEENCRDLPLDCRDIPTDDFEWLYMYRPSEGNCEQLSVNCTHHSEYWDDLCKTFKVFFKDSNFNKDRFYDEFLKIEEGDQYFMKNIFTVLKSFSERAVANYFALNFYLEHLGELNFYFQRTKERYFSRGRCEPWRPKPISVGWEVCTQWISKMMSFPLQFEFHKKYLTLQEIEKISDLFKECISDEINAVTRQEWMPEEEKKSLSYELNHVQFNLNKLKLYLPHRELYESSLNDIYKSFHPTGESFLYNVLELRQTISDMYKMTSSISMMQGYNFELQAYAGNYFTTYVLHFGLLITPYYVPNLERLMNLVMFTTTTGHEIGHFVDHYAGLIGNETLRRVEETKDCLKNQYSDFKLEFSLFVSEANSTVNRNLNGSQYVDENLADLAYAEMVDRFIEKYVSLEEDILLPGFPYSSKQMLYLAENVNWCSKSVESEELFFKDVETHSPHKIRLLGTMRNSRGFSEAFNCSEGSYMNPALKCRLMT